MKKRRLRPWVIIAFILICLISIVYFSYKVITWKIHVDSNNKIKEELKEKVTIKNNTTQDIIKYEIDFKSLKEMNPDTIAYIKVNNTNIDYVVVRGIDNSYYLSHNFLKTWNVAGWVFGDYRNKFDGTDKNLIIYGHNTKDGSMFDTLINILNKDWYENEENREVILVTEQGTYYYQVFSTYGIKPEDYYITTNFSSDNEFDSFVKKLKSRSVYDYGVDVSFEDRILTLSSCIGDGKKRVVLHAKLIEKDLSILN